MCIIITLFYSGVKGSLLDFLLCAEYVWPSVVCPEFFKILIQGHSAPFRIPSETTNLQKTLQLPSIQMLGYQSSSQKYEHIQIDNLGQFQALKNRKICQLLKTKKIIAFLITTMFSCSMSRQQVPLIRTKVSNTHPHILLQFDAAQQRPTKISSILVRQIMRLVKFG